MVRGWVQSLSFGVDVEVPEIIPVAVFDDGPLLQDRLRPGDGPAHAALFHAIFDQRPAGTLNHAGGDRVALLEIGVVVHHMAVVVEVGDRFFEDLFLRAGEVALVLGAPLSQAADDIADLAFQERIELLFYPLNPVGALFAVEGGADSPQVFTGVGDVQNAGL